MIEEREKIFSDINSRFDREAGDQFNRGDNLNLNQIIWFASQIYFNIVSVFYECNYCVHILLFNQISFHWSASKINSDKT
jgi:hypothetical protein